MRFFHHYFQLMVEKMKNGIWQVMPMSFRDGKNKYIFIIACLMMMEMLVFGYLRTYENSNILSVGYVFSILTLLFLAGRVLSVRVALHCGLILGVMVLFYATSQTGGIFSVELAWLLILPLIPYYILSPQHGYRWLMISLALYAVIALFTRMGWWFHYVPTLNSDYKYFLSQNLFAVLNLSILPLIFYIKRNAVIKKTKQKHKELLKKQAEMIEISRRHEKFISTISHELRTPMNAIVGFSALMGQELKSQPDAYNLLKHSQNSAEHLLTVINDVIDYSQSHSGRLSAHMEKVDLRTVVYGAFELFSLRMEESAVRYRCEVATDVPTRVFTDRHRLMQILVNLLGNAIKFTGQGEVSLVIEKRDGGVVFQVSDTGIGIAEDKQALIFQRFEQADQSIQTQFGGNGLGLSITQKLVTLLGGRIGLKSTLGQGSTFWFELPLSEMGADEVKKHEDPLDPLRSAQTHWHFLVVDDHQVNRLLVRQVLSRAWPHSQIWEAQDGVEALRVIACQQIDLVLMDMLMPVMDGAQTTEAIRQMGGPQGRVPIIGLTANVNPADLEAFKAAGLTTVLLKPFQAAKLQSIVDNALLEHTRGLH